MSIDVLVINRRADRGRMDRFASSAGARGIDYRRLEALDAHGPGFPLADHTDLIGAHFWGASRVKPGAIGCFLSHRRAWQAVLEGGSERSLICEDDAVFTEGLDRLDAVATQIGRSHVVFANGRLASWCAAVAEGAPHMRVPAVVSALARRGGPRAQGLKQSPGADCYIVSREGAERLLALTAAQRIVCGVDWAMVWNALPPPAADVRAAFPELDILSRHLATAEPPIPAHALAVPVADQGGGPSVLRHDVTMDIEELRAIR